MSYIKNGYRDNTVIQYERAIAQAIRAGDNDLGNYLIIRLEEYIRCYQAPWRKTDKEEK